MSTQHDNVLVGPGLEQRGTLERDLVAAYLSPAIVEPFRSSLERLEPRCFLTPSLRATYNACRELEAEGTQPTPENVAALAAMRNPQGTTPTASELVGIMAEAPAVTRVPLMVDRLLKVAADHKKADVLSQLRDAVDERGRLAAAGADTSSMDTKVASLEQELAEAPKAVDWAHLLVPWHEIKTEPVSYLVDRLVYAGTLSVLVGKPGSGKTFAAVSLACSVASGRPWLDHIVRKPGPVVYIAAEGLNAMNERVRAWATHNGVDAGELDDVIVLNTDEQGVALSNPAHLAGLTEGMRTKGVQPALIVVDTWNMAAGLTDENSNAEVGTVAQGLTRLASSTGAAILIVAHPAKMGGNGEVRGAGALLGSVRSVLSLDEKRTLRHTKNNLGAMVEPIGVELVSVPNIREAQGQAPEPVAVMVTAEATVSITGADELLVLLEELGGRYTSVSTKVLAEAAAERWGMGQSSLYAMRARLLRDNRAVADGRGLLRIVTD